MTIEEGIELWKAGDPESARDALRYALSACHDNIWAHVALGQIALVEFRDPALARGHFGYAFELAHRALPQGFKGRLPRDRPNNRPFYEAIDGLAQSLEALGRHGDSKSLRALGARLAGGPIESVRATWFAGRFGGAWQWRVVGSMVFSTLGIFRTCRDLRIGIERPQIETKKPRK